MSRMTRKTSLPRYGNNSTTEQPTSCWILRHRGNKGITTMRAQIALLWLSCIQSNMVTSLPMFLVDSPKAKCVQIEAAQDTMIRVEYDAPDIEVDKDSDAYGPTFLTVNLDPSGRVTDTSLHSAPIRSKLKNTSEVLKERKGMIKHKFEYDGVASICIRSSTAGSSKVQLFGLRVETDQNKPVKEDVDPDKHLSHMEVEMNRILTGMTSVIKQAEFTKERDEVFQEQTAHMHEAAMWWPVVQVCVLIMTGFTQASHITRFFKSRRII